MYFLQIHFILFIFYEKLFATIYDRLCITTCNMPGMICENGRCICDIRNRFFWTGSRCLLCPYEWGISETRCVGYYGTKMSWSKAQATCQDMQADLISFRDNSILPLIYQVTGGMHQYRKREIATDKTIAWSSAHAVELADLGSYEWNDNSLPKFDSTHHWWCRIGIPDLGYYHPFTEPTRLVYDQQEEKCVLFRRGKSSAPMLCLDDVLCTEEYPFVCEKTESTALKFIGPAPPDEVEEPKIETTTTTEATTTMSTTTMTSTTTITRTTTITTTTTTSTTTITTTTTTRIETTRTTSTSSSTKTTRQYLQIIKQTVNNAYVSPVVVSPDALKSDSKKNKKPLIVLISVGLLLLAGILGGVFFCLKKRKIPNTPLPIQQKQASNRVQPVIQSVPNIINEPPPKRTSVDEIGLSLGANLSPEKFNFNIGNQKQQKNKRGGYSKQQFDEFE